MSDISQRIIRVLEDKCRLQFTNEEELHLPSGQFIVDGTKYYKAFKNNNLDSLDIIEMIMETEKEFNIHIDEDLLTVDSSFVDLEKLVEDQLKMKVL